MTTSSVPVENLGAFINRVGAWNLHDHTVRAMHVAATDGAVSVDVEIVVPDWIGVNGTSESVFTLRCIGVEELSLSQFSDQDMIAEYAFERASHPENGSAGVRITLATHEAGVVLSCFSARVEMMPESLG